MGRREKSRGKRANAKKREKGAQGEEETEKCFLGGGQFEIQKSWGGGVPKGGGKKGGGGKGGGIGTRKQGGNGGAKTRSFVPGRRLKSQGGKGKGIGGKKKWLMGRDSGRPNFKESK